MYSEETEVLLANRAFLYALVARGFAAEPDDAFLEVLTGEHARLNVALAAERGGERLVELFDELVRHASLPGAREELAQEYVRVFVGPGTLKAVPYETALLSGKRALFQPQLLEIREFYRQAGFEPVALHHVPDDFIATEFDFLAKLAAQALSAWQEGDAAQANQRVAVSNEFLDAHVLKWVGRFAAEVAAAYGDCFCARFSQFAHLVARWDADISRGQAL